MKNKKLYLSLLIGCIPFILGLIFYTQMPTQLPIHFDANSVADSFAHKSITLFVMPVILIIFQIFVVWILENDPKNKNMPTSLLNIVYWIMPFISIMITTITILYGLKIKVEISMFLNLFLGIAFLFIGNYMPKIKQNYTMGIKLLGL